MGCSRFTRVPAFHSPMDVLRMVSAERSAENLSPRTDTTVRQQPSTAMLLATARCDATPEAWMVRWPPSASSLSDSTVPICSMMPVNMSLFPNLEPKTYNYMPATAAYRG